MRALVRGRTPRLATEDSRRGAATIEFAVCLPIIVLLVFGSIEASGLIFLRQSLDVAAYEGLRAAVDVRGSAESGRQRATAVLRQRNVRDFDIRFPNGNPADADRGDDVVITIQAPTASNSAMVGRYISTGTLRAEAVMVKQ